MYIIKLHMCPRCTRTGPARGIVSIRVPLGVFFWLRIDTVNRYKQSWYLFRHFTERNTDSIGCAALTGCCGKKEETFRLLADLGEDPGAGVTGYIMGNVPVPAATICRPPEPVLS